MIDKIRHTLFELSVIVLIGVSIAVVGVYIWNLVRTPTIEDFKRAYNGQTLDTQVAVAEHYLNYFSIDELNRAVEASNTTSLCHQQAHALGRALYKRVPNFAEATKQCGNACTYGCFHGVMMGLFSTNSDTLGGIIDADDPVTYLKQMKSMAKDLCTKAELEGVVHPRYCYHALGHVFSYLDGTTLAEPLTWCDIFPAGGARGSCVSGVFMEYLMAPASKAVLYTKGAEPCDAYPQFTKRCYRFKAYGWLYAWGGLKPAFAFCDTLGENTLMCIKNIAEAASSPKVVASEAGMETLCGSLAGEKREACMDGAIVKVISVSDGDDSEHVCDPVASTEHERCLRVREEYRDDLYF
jgi:hypothetical protein